MEPACPQADEVRRRFLTTARGRAVSRIQALDWSRVQAEDSVVSALVRAEALPATPVAAAAKVNEGGR